MKSLVLSLMFSLLAGVAVAATSLPATGDKPVPSSVPSEPTEMAVIDKKLIDPDAVETAAGAAAGPDCDNDPEKAVCMSPDES